MKDAALVLLAYGRANVRAQAYVNLLSLLRFWEEDTPRPIIRVYTDLEEDFAPLKQWVQPVYLDNTQIQAWAGPSGYHHLAKVHLLESLLGETAAPLLFMDADIYWLKDARPLLGHISPGAVVMERCEGALDERRDNLSKKLERRFRRRDVLWNSKPRRLSVDVPVYNSGLLGLHPAQRAHLPSVATLATSLFQTFRKHPAEQLAYSYVLAERGISIHTAEGFLWHYWPNQQLIVPQVIRFVQQYRHRPLEEQFEAVGELIEQLEQLPRRTPRPLPKRIEAAVRGWWLDVLHQLAP